MLLQSTYMSELDDSFEVILNTDSYTLTAISEAQIFCKLSSKECEQSLLFEGYLKGTTVKCLIGRVDLASKSPLFEISLIFDETEIPI